ncbi:MAG TPA: oligosaccharide flippase family protein [Solirubrobacteraceae bacterium]
MAEEQLSAPEVKRRAVIGAVVDALRVSGVRLITVAGTIVIARLLTPYALGLVTIGATVYAFGDFLDDGGVGVALIRRPEPPTKAELQALLAFQLGIDLLIVVAVGLVALPFGEVGRITTVVVCCLPFGAFRAPAYIIYERQLSYRPMAAAELIQTCVYYAWGVGTVILGWGVWGLATAFVVRELTGSIVILAVLPEGRMLPVPSWTRIRGSLKFGVQVQAVGLLHMIRDQGVNVLVAAFGGVAMLGLWGVAWRIIQLPVSLISALWRISLPGMAKLVAAKEDVGSTIERVIPLVAIGTGVLIVPLAASAESWIHVLMGAQWTGAASAIPGACFAMAFGIPISVALTGYLWAIGNSSVPMRATAVGIPATLLVVAALEPLIGLTGVGIAYIASSLVESIFFVVAARRTTSFRIGARLAVPVLAATGSWLCGWLVQRAIGPDLAGAVCASGVSLVAFVAVLAVAHRAYLTDAWTLVGRGLRGVTASPVTA